jgi:glucosamine--fructose-6-phosphate aminotransferase (isomerizing)
VYLEDGELATITPDDFVTNTLQAHRTAKTPTTVDLDDADCQLGSYANFMHREIWEQPEPVRRTLLGRLDERFGTAGLGGINLDPQALRAIRSVKFVGCGSRRSTRDRSA